jgi:hypothetical protein
VNKYRIEHEWKWENDLEWCVVLNWNKKHCLFEGTILACVWEYWEKNAEETQ